jgi:CRP/FNR family transcriptional regulator, nitrogen fixation regulation protein
MTQLALSVAISAPVARQMPVSGSWTKSMAAGGLDVGGALRAIGPVLHFAQDRDIYSEGDNADVFFKLVSGVVRTCKFLSDGRRQIDSFYVAGEVFGLEAADAHSLCAEAVSDCTVISYRRRGLEALAANDHALSRRLFSHAMKNLARAQEHSLSLGRRNAVEKIAAFLVDLFEKAPDAKVITLAMTRQDIADYLGLTMETVSRTLSQLERDAFIELTTARQIRMKDRTALRGLNS